MSGLRSGSTNWLAEIILVSMTTVQRFWWQVALELKLRKCSGDAFQDFFSTVMDKVHGSDFVRVRPFGSLGDKGCDGYLQSSGQVFQCYGALNGQLGGGKVTYLVHKMGDDFAKAVQAIASIMKEWHMVHNLVDGLPVEALVKLEQMKMNDSERKFGFIGIEGLKERIFSLEVAEIEDLLGVVATSQDTQNLQAEELRDLIAGIAAAADDLQVDVTSIRPVRPDKLEFNQLPGHWRALIKGGWQNTDLVTTYLDRHRDPLVGERVAQVFRVRYRYLRDQHLSPGAIMTALYEFVAGIGTIPPSRQVAAQALLAFLFESCDIFEDKPPMVA
jgi:hypothetical protein